MIKERVGAGLRTNFWSYSKRAVKAMDHPEILRQLRKHWKRLDAEIEVADRERRRWCSR